MAAQIKQYTLTLNGSAQRLSAVYASGAANADPTALEDIAYTQVILCADPANANAVSIGASASVSATNAGVVLDPTQATAQDRVSLGPFPVGSIKLSQLWAIGTTSQRLFILAVGY